jgi:hypothetical protein
MKAVIITVTILAIIGAIVYDLATDRNVSIEKEETLHSYCEKEYTVKTLVWVRNGFGFPVTLEWSEYAFVKAHLIDSTKASQSKLADSVKSKILSCLPD